MLTITREQVAVFEEANLSSFTARMVQHLRRVLPEAVASLDDERLQGAVRTRMDQALAYGITDRFEIRRYLECSYLLRWSDAGPDEEARRALEREDLKPDARLDLIEQRTASV